MEHLEQSDCQRHSTPRTTTGRKGFTFLEVLVAMSLLAFGLLAFAGLLKAIGSVEGEDTWETKALFCAQERMEELKFDCLAGKTFETEGKEIVGDGPYKGIQREWRAKSSAVFEGLLEFNVRCAYPWKGSTKGVELKTLVCFEE
jgi:prepilin-type N-terminal cleavage/methylation domain-containing protein